MAHTLYVEFEDGKYLDIELVENNPLLEMWIDLHHKNKESTGAKYLSRKGMYLYHGVRRSEAEQEAMAAKRENAVYEINKAIDAWNKKIPEYPFPYSAFNGMSWEQTNLIHRAFTTALRTKGCFDLKESRERLIDFKYHNHLIDELRNPKYRVFQPVEKDDWTFLTFPQNEVYSILERINKWVHVYEDNSYSEQAFNSLPLEQHDAKYLEIEWDVYNQDGSKSYHIERIPNRYRKYCNYDYHNVDVYICKNITGKDYIQAYHENDDPLQWDIVNMDHINGGITVDPNQFLFNWLHHDATKKWLLDYNVPYDLSILQPPAIGKVRNRDWFIETWPLVDWDKSTTQTSTTGTLILNNHGIVKSTEVY